jgi:hypothetical protein
VVWLISAGCQGSEIVASLDRDAVLCRVERAVAR